MASSPSSTSSTSAFPWWINKVSSFGDFVQATFEPCSCSRGVPPKQVKQEKIRIISNRTREEAFEMLLNKVNTAQ
jgi:hypothetical protein